MASDQPQCVVIGADRLGVGNPAQCLEQLVGCRAQEGERLAAAAHGVGQAVGLRGAENEDHVWRRLLERLQQRVGGVGRERVGLVEDVDAIAAEDGLLVDAIANLADVIDTAIAGRVELEHVQRGAVGNRATRLAFEARRRGRRVEGLAVERLAEDLRQRRLAGTARAGEEVRVAHAALFDRVRQRLHDVALADDVREVLRTVLTVERGHVVSLPAGRGRHATSADLRPAEET